MGLVQQSDFSAKYTNVSENRWVAAAKLVDPQHNIVTELEITTPDLIVSNARIDFRKGK